MQNLEHVRIERSNQITTVVLERPDVHNAFNEVVIQELTKTFDTLGEDSETRVIILTGSGKSFSAGADLGWMKKMVDYSREDNVRDAREMAQMFRAIDRCPKPVIARVQGAALGGGSGLVAAADIAVASEKARFAFSEVRLGIIPAVISPFVLAKIGGRAARRYFLTGERFSAERAQEIGLVSQVVAPDDLDEAVDKIAGDILLGGPSAVRAAKDLVFAVESAADLDEAVAVTAERIAECRAGTEGQEGMRAFLEKRPAAWIDGATK